MARPPILLILLLLCVQIESLHANTPISRTYDRFKKNCEDGSGMACYSYGRAVWNTGNRKDSLHYFARACELKYKLACQAYKDHSTIVRQTHRGSKTGVVTSACFSKKDMETAKLTPQPAMKTGIEGQKITGIKKGSFWEKAGLKDGDVIARLNNMHVDTEPEFQHAFESSGKSFGLEVVRDGDTITLWYSCH